MSTTPYELTTKDWEEVRQNETVIESWSLMSEETAEDLRAAVSAVKFDFEPQMMPNYRGEVILLLGESLEPLVLVRNKDRKLVASSDPRGGRSGSLRKKETIFVTVEGGVAEVDASTVPDGIGVEIVDADDLESDTRAALKLSREAQVYAKQRGFL